MQRVNWHLPPLITWSPGVPRRSKSLWDESLGTWDESLGSWQEGFPADLKESTSHVAGPSTRLKRVHKESGSQLWLKPGALGSHDLAGIGNIHQLPD